jgi:hypothetical protein
MYMVIFTIIGRIKKKGRKVIITINNDDADTLKKGKDT